jgi:hypothetical protein
LLPTTQTTDRQLTFELSVRIGNSQANGVPNLLGPFTHGPPAGRFLAIVSGTLAGQVDSCWTRGAKVQLASITWPLVEQAQAMPDAVIEARIAGTAKDGGPACATVSLLNGGWRVVPQHSSDDASEPPH